VLLELVLLFVYTANIGAEQLVDGKVFRFAFLQNGFLATTAGLITYFLVSDITAYNISEHPQTFC
jgi:hypothetical protein